MVFLSSRPEAEHHELVLMGGRTAGRKAKLLQQLSFHVDSLEELRRFHRAFKDEGVEISTTVTHGNTASIYFLDPEGNRLEVYVSLPYEWPQPFGEPIDLEQDDGRHPPPDRGDHGEVHLTPGALPCEGKGN